MSIDLPSFVSRELQSEESLRFYIPQPDLTACRRIILAMSMPFVTLVIALVWFFYDRTSVIASAAAVFCVTALFVFTLRLCRTSYFISGTRIIRFIGERKAEEVSFANCARPFLRDFSASSCRIERYMARFFSLGPVVQILRLKADPWTFAAFITSRDTSGMRIGYPGHSLPIAKVFEDITVAWEATQSAAAIARTINPLGPLP